MPLYKRRLPDAYPREYFNYDTNPEGYEFACAFCEVFFKTKSGRLSHMKRCVVNHTGEEYDEECYLNGDLTVADHLRAEEELSTIIRQFIQSNELEPLSDQTGDQIQTYIKAKIQFVNIGRDSVDFKVFKMYEFFFEVTESEKDKAYSDAVDHFMEHYDRTD